MKKDLIYLDNAATTRISGNVLEAMMPWLTEGYGNASSMYTSGRQSAIALSKARESCAASLGCEPREIYFTSGGSESDNWAIRSAAAVMAQKGKRHIICSAFEHHAVLNPLETLKKQGFEITYLPVYENGIVKPEDVSAALREDTALVSVMYVNNEIGTVQPISEIGALCRERGVLFHTDAVQAAGNAEIDVSGQNIDMLSLSGHKIHAMKGTGLLYVKSSVPLIPLIEGGAQERGRRAGTENIAGIVGLAKALEEASGGVSEKNARLLPLREKLIERISAIEGTRLNGDRERRIAANVNFSFAGIEGEALMLQLDLKGIAVSSGSACTSGSLDPSHVILALGRSRDEARGSLRITMSEYTTEEETDRLIEELIPITEKLRSMSPLWQRMKGAL